MEMKTGSGASALPPHSVCGYIEDMLMELAALAHRIGEPELAPHIEAAAARARQVAQRHTPADKT